MTQFKPQAFKDSQSNDYFITYVNGAGYYNRSNQTILGQFIGNAPSGIYSKGTRRINFDRLEPIESFSLANHLIDFYLTGQYK